MPNKQQIKDIFRLYYRAILGRIVNTMERNFLSRCISVMIMFLIIFAVLQPEVISLTIPGLVTMGAMLIISIGIGLNGKRMSNNVLYTWLPSKEAGMIIRDLTRYRRLDYISPHHTAVANLLKEEFIEGLQHMAKQTKGKEIYLITHQWVVDNVINSPEVQQLYEVTIKKGGDAQIAHDILLLVKFSYIHRNLAWFLEHALRPRARFHVFIKAKD